MSRLNLLAPLTIAALLANSTALFTASPAPEERPQTIATAVSPAGGAYSKH